jgi:hypothetical protein
MRLSRFAESKNSCRECNVDNQTALSSLRDSEARLQSALDHVQAAIKVLKPAEVLPTPTMQTWAIPSKEELDEEVRTLERLPHNHTVEEFWLDKLDEEEQPKKRRVGRPCKRGSAAWRRRISESNKQFWASLSPDERAERLARMQAGR